MSIVLEQSRPRHFCAPPAHACRPRAAPIDEAGHALIRIARGALQRVPHVIPECTTASQGTIESRGALDLPQTGGSAWRFSCDGRRLYCVLENDAERLLLGWIVGAAPPARSLSKIERSIVAEAIKQMFFDTASTTVEELHDRPNGTSIERVWYCEFALCAADGRSARIVLAAHLEPQETTAPVHRLDLSDVEIQLRAAISGLGCQLSEVRQWQPGSLLRFHRPQHDLTVLLYAAGRRIAAAQLGTVGERRALRLISVGSVELR